MLQSFFKGNNDSFKIVVRLISIIFICLFTVTVFMCIAAFSISRINFSYEILPTVTAVVLGISAALDALLISKKFRENGLIWGIFVGIIILLSIIIISLVLKSFAFSAELFTKAAVTLTSGAIGGIIGVNMR